MNVPDHLTAHLRNPRFQDYPSKLVVPGDNRLTHEYQQWNGDWKSIAREVSERADIAWCPDANVVILDETEPVWTALRIAGLGSTKTMISSAVGMEIKEWIDDPFRNKQRAADLRNALEQKTWAQRLELSPSIYRAVVAYARLIGLRRMLCLNYSNDGCTILNTNPNDKADTMNAVINAFGPRAIALARKGRRDAEAGKPINIFDECHCIMAIAHALCTGRETVILTADADHLEVFRKAQWFLTTHYRAWAAAALVKEGCYGAPEIELSTTDTSGFFLGPLSIYRRHTNLLPEALPSKFRPVHVHVIYVGPDCRIVRMASHFEREMLDMLEIRANTGRCTDLYEDRNIHIDLSPIFKAPTGWLIGIGKDVIHTFQDRNVSTDIPALDIEHAIQCRERIQMP